MLGHRRSRSAVEEGLKREACHQTKTDLSVAQVLDDSGHSRGRREMVRGWKHAPTAAPKMAAIGPECLVQPISSE